MRRVKASIILIFVLCLIGFSERVAVSVHAKISPGPPLGMTGAPGEGTCIGCHYSYGGANSVPNLGPGRVQLSGLPANYTPGQTYVVTLTITANAGSAQRWGFELTALAGQGDSSTAGELAVTDAARVLKRSAFIADRPRIYLSHNDEAGTSLGRTGTNSWSFNWTAPSSSAGEITFYATGNAADGQVTPEGDYIYSTLVTVSPPAPVVALQALAGLSSYLAAVNAAPVELRVRGNFGAEAQLSFNNVQLPTQPVADGLLATLPANQLMSPGVYPVRLKLGNGELTNSLNFVVANNLSSNAVVTVDAASYALAVAPGQIAALFGVALTSNPIPAQASELPLPRTLQNTAVYVNGVAAPLFFTSDGQLNFQVPYSTFPGLASVIVLREDGTAAQGYVNVYPTAPALFAANASGRGQAVALNADYTPNGDPATNALAKRAAKGSYVFLFGTGTGAQLSNGQAYVPNDGEGASGNPLIETNALPSVTIGGRAATVGFSGLVPGLVGLWQLNVQVPLDAPSGRNVDVLVSWGNRVSNQVTLALE
jgi:uncharacterized protein (TIGR03437 family)